MFGNDFIPQIPTLDVDRDFGTILRFYVEVFNAQNEGRESSGAF
jgi:hypothetical protein